VTAYLVDTNVISEFAKPDPNPHVIAWLQQTDPASLFASVITFGEIRLGIENLAPGRRRTELDVWFATGLPAWFAANLLPATRETADHWARLSIRAKRQGLALTTPDGLIAATALEHGLTLATRNVGDFTGLDVGLFNPWEPHLASQGQI
jgi:predicted nucleic acid-binding protein